MPAVLPLHRQAGPPPPLLQGSMSLLPASAPPHPPTAVPLGAAINPPGVPGRAPSAAAPPPTGGPTPLGWLLLLLHLRLQVGPPPGGGGLGWLLLLLVVRRHSPTAKQSKSCLSGGDPAAAAPPPTGQAYLDLSWSQVGRPEASVRDREACLGLLLPARRPGCPPTDDWLADCLTFFYRCMCFLQDGLPDPLPLLMGRPTWSRTAYLLQGGQKSSRRCWGGQDVLQTQTASSSSQESVPPLESSAGC